MDEADQDYQEAFNYVAPLPAAPADWPNPPTGLRDRFAAFNARVSAGLRDRRGGFFGRGSSRPAPERLSRNNSMRVEPSTSPRFDPEATEFVPRAPTKRKASSSARPSKSLHAPYAAASSSRSANNTGGIPYSELFGPHSQALTSFSSVASAQTAFEEAEDDDEEDSDMDLAFHLPLLSAENPNQRINVFGQPTPDDRQAQLQRVLERQTLTMKVPPVGQSPAGNKSAVILFSYDRADDSELPWKGNAKLRFIPLGLTRHSQDTAIEKCFSVLRDYRQHLDNAALRHTPSRATWPAGEVPMELFDLITDHLSRDDIKSMRLVNKEFEKKVSSTLFHTSVVPFNTELYDMIEEDTKAANRATTQNSNPRDKGKGRAQDLPGQFTDRSLSGLQWQNAREDAEGKVYRGHGLRVFQGFGPHIKRFGMSFEVAETQLSRPPIKKDLANVDSYHGSYDWPHRQYTRFENLAGLEKTADETLRMKAAFSNLGEVQELALSMDSGLGWLSGPDKSVRAHIFERSSPVFGLSRPDNQMQDAQSFWSALQASHRSHGLPGVLKEANLARNFLQKSPGELQGFGGAQYADTRQWPSISASQLIPALLPLSASEPRYGVLSMSSSQPSSLTTELYDKSALVPANLRKEQKEWLLETEWAQRAFLECYMLAVIDNASLFSNVKSLNLAKLSSSFLPLLGRDTFWDSLPGLSAVTLHVKPDWRTVEKDNAGYAETSPQNPSEAVRDFNRFIRHRLCLRPAVKQLNIGWVGGGEHEIGMYARNTSLLPCPITQLEHSTAANANFGLVFKFVENLTLSNCWITPTTLQQLVKNHAGMALKTLTLNSVSLTAHPRYPGGQQQQIAQAIAALQPGNNQPQQGAAWNLLQQFQLGAQNQPGPPPAPTPAPILQAGNNAQPIAPLVGNQTAFQAMVNQHAAQQQNLHQQNLQQQALQQQAIPQQNAAAVAHQQFLAAFLAQQGVGAQAQMQVMQQMQPAINAGAWNPNWLVQQLAAAQLPGQMPNPNAQLNPAPPSHWTDGHREGSWPDLINDISPGPIFTDYLPQPQPWETQHPPRATTNLQTIEFKSCGYARLINNHTFDQANIEAMDNHALTSWFRTRQGALAPAMMTTTDRYIGRIVQHIPQRELDAMLFAWGLTEGWSDREKAEEAEFDGLFAGGTGRFSGKIEVGTQAVPPPPDAGSSNSQA